MKTLEKRPKQPIRKHQMGWVTSTDTSMTHRKGWITSVGAPATTLNHEPAILGNTSEALTVNCQALSADLVDALAYGNLDWISVLPNNWQLEASSCLYWQPMENDLNMPFLAIKEWVQSISQTDCYLAILNSEPYWIHTHCPYFSELGKVRIVVCCRERDKSKEHIALITNRLDWSPCNIISQVLNSSQVRIF